MVYEFRTQFLMKLLRNAHGMAVALKRSKVGAEETIPCLEIFI